MKAPAGSAKQLDFQSPSITAQQSFTEGRAIRRIGVMLFHGMGRQQRFFTLAELAEFFCRTLGCSDTAIRFVTHHGEQQKQILLEAELGGEQCQFTLMEAYWAPLGRSRSSGLSTLAWLFSRLSTLVYKMPGLNPKLYAPIPHIPTVASRHAESRGGRVSPEHLKEVREEVKRQWEKYWRQFALTTRLLIFIGLIPLVLTAMGAVFTAYAAYYVGQQAVSGSITPQEVVTALTLALLFIAGKGIYFLALMRSTADESADALAARGIPRTSAGDFILRCLKAVAATVIAVVVILSLTWNKAGPLLMRSAQPAHPFAQLPAVGGTLVSLDFKAIVDEAAKILPNYEGNPADPMHEFLVIGLHGTYWWFVIGITLLLTALYGSVVKARARATGQQAVRLDDSARFAAFFVLLVPSLAAVHALVGLMVSGRTSIALAHVFIGTVVLTLAIYLFRAPRRGFPTWQMMLMLLGGAMALWALGAAVANSHSGISSIPLALIIGLTGYSLATFVLSYVVDYLGDVSAFMTQDENDSRFDVRNRILACGLQQLELVGGEQVAQNPAIDPRFDGYAIEPSAGRRPDADGDDLKGEKFDDVLLMAHSLGTAVAYASLCHYCARLLELDSAGVSGRRDRLSGLKVRLKALITFGSPLDVLRMIFEPLPAANEHYDDLRLYGLQAADADDLNGVFAEGTVWENWYNDFDIVSSNVEMYGGDVRNEKLALAGAPIANHSAYLTTPAARERLKKILREQLRLKVP